MPQYGHGEMSLTVWAFTLWSLSTHCNVSRLSARFYRTDATTRSPRRERSEVPGLGWRIDVGRSAARPAEEAVGTHERGGFARR